MPHSIEAEEAVLGSILLDGNDLIEKCLEFIPNSEVFYSTKSQLLWDYLIELKNERIKIDTISVISKFKEKDKQILDAYWITGLGQSCPSTHNVDYYAKIVLEKFLQRKLIESSTKVQEMAYNNTMEFERILDEVNRYTTELQELQPLKEFNIEEGIDEAIEDIKKPDNVVSYGYKALDSLAGGMTKGEVTVVAGRPGHGKTTFSVNLAMNFLKQGMKVALINREMSNKEMFKKLLVLESGCLSYKDIRLGNMTQDDYDVLTMTRNDMIDKYNKKLFMYDDIKDIDSAHSLIRKIKPDVVIDDYIQLVKVNGKKDRRFEIEQIMQDYKWLAKFCKIPVILLSQLNREIEKREDPIPKTSDLAESGSIEQVAENILFVYYDYKIRYEKSYLGKNQMQIVAAKVRYGETGIATLGFEGNRCLFANSKEDIIYKGGSNG
jgi:replicative DNA helicase